MYENVWVAFAMSRTSSDLELANEELVHDSKLKSNWVRKVRGWLVRTSYWEGGGALSRQSFEDTDPTCGGIISSIH